MCPSEGDRPPALQRHQKAASQPITPQSVTKFSPCLSFTVSHLCCPKFWIKTGYDGVCLLSQHPGERHRTVENLRLAWTIHSETLSSKKKTNKRLAQTRQWFLRQGVLWWLQALGHVSMLSPYYCRHLNLGSWGWDG